MAKDHVDALQKHPELRKLLVEMANMIRQSLPPEYGFTLVTFSRDSEYSKFYISTAPDADMIRILEQFLKEKTRSEIK